ncbi:hypothetical protein Rsub_02408 [Raphidocelis subcapitata]|uniref:Uncharacterized protein n=1 Tax=Raphidocelis subcapitata TaxID=307507 RepID=A0A2V0NUF4_9CHLO|nr:hypothetical protein Rsub_02408 [Raphidocelis subcapitata]|eukprot:GBF90302.1 hypothetical protein Rsub_02408 [Raphidocelis subcapitata]
MLRPGDPRMWCALGQCYESPDLNMPQAGLLSFPSASARQAAVRCYRRAVANGDREGIALHKLFSNCLTYTDAAGFSAALGRALSEDPAPMDDATLGKLSWEAATERLLEVSEIRPAEWPSGREARYDDMLWRMYRSVVGFSALRAGLGISSTSPDDRPTEDGSSDDERAADWELWHDLTSIGLASRA